MIINDLSDLINVGNPSCHKLTLTGNGTAIAPIELVMTGAGW